MARPHKTDEGTGKPISIRLTDEIQTMLELAAKKLDLPVSAVMRLCFRVGSAQFKRVNYDLASAILDAPDAASQSQTKKTDTEPDARFAELLADLSTCGVKSPIFCIVEDPGSTDLIIGEKIRLEILAAINRHAIVPAKVRPDIPPDFRSPARALFVFDNQEPGSSPHHPHGSPRIINSVNQPTNPDPIPLRRDIKYVSPKRPKK